MAVKLPTIYPPELPANIAWRIKSESKTDTFHSAVLLGQSLASNITDLISSKKFTLHIGKDNEDAGFFIIDRSPYPPAILYRCFSHDLLAELEAASIALHTFKRLNAPNLIIFDSVKPFQTIDDPLLRVYDHINMTGINPLDFWMMNEEPDPFFLDIRNLYKSQWNKTLNLLDKITHFAISDNTDPHLLNAAQAHAQTFGRAFVPESILAAYLGMNPSAVAVNPDSKNYNPQSLANSILNIISSE